MLNNYGIDLNGRIVILDYWKDFGVGDNCVSTLTIEHFDNGILICNVETRHLHRNKKYCQKLLKFVLQWKRDYYLHVHPDNLIAMHIYKKLGFKMTNDPAICDYLTMKFIYNDKSN